MGAFFILVLLLIIAMIASSDLDVHRGAAQASVVLPNTGNSGVHDPPYTIQPGDTLESIAARNNITLEILLQYNPQITDPLSITPGQVINIPVFDNPSNIGGGGDTSAVTATGKTYTVCQGDTLYKIATSYGTTVNAVLSVNPQITNRNLIYPGQVINIP